MAMKLQATGVRAGKGKGSEVLRKVQNKGVAHGTIRLGKGGKSYNFYDAKKGVWVKGAVKAVQPARTTSTPKTKRVSAAGSRAKTADSYSASTPYAQVAAKRSATADKRRAVTGAAITAVTRSPVMGAAYYAAPKMKNVPRNVSAASKNVKRTVKAKSKVAKREYGKGAALIGRTTSKAGRSVNQWYRGY